MEKIIFLIIFTLLFFSVHAALEDEGDWAMPDTTSTPVEIVETFDAPSPYPEGLVFDGTYLWSTSIRADTLFKHNPDTGEVISTITAPGADGPMDLAWDGEFLWNADYGTNKIYQFTTSGEILKEFDSPGEQPMGLTWDGEFLWHTDYTLQKIYKMNTDGEIISEFDSPGQKPHGLAWDGEFLWNSDAVTYNIYKLDTSGNVLEKYYFPHSYPTGLALQDNFLWMGARDTQKIYKIRIPETQAQNPVPETTASEEGIADSSWPKFHGNLKNTGLSPYDTSHVDGTVKWIFEVDDEFEGSISIAPDETLYIGGHNNIFYAINPEDGSEKWRFKAGDPVYTAHHDDWKGIISTPAISSDGTIYFTSLSNYLFALNSDGTEKWRFPIKTTEAVWSSPTIAPDGTIYVGAANEVTFDAAGNMISGPVDDTMNGLFAINPDGTLKWKFINMGDMFPSPAIGDDGTIYVGAADGDAMVGKLYAINPEDGTEKWHFVSPTHIESSPAIASDGTIYIGSWDDHFYAINPDGSLKWKYKTDGAIISTPAIAPNGTIYVASNDKYFYAFNSDGTVKWRVFLDGGEELPSSPAIGADGTIYVGSSWSSQDADTFFAIDPNGTIKWSYDAGSVGSSPAIASDGTVYIASYNFNIFAFGGPGEAQETSAENRSGEALGPCEYMGINTTSNMPFQSYYLDEEFIGIDVTSPGLDDNGKVNDLEQLRGLTCLQYFESGHNEISGDLANLEDLVDLEVINMHTNPEVHGDICSLKDATNLRVLVLAFNPDVHGDISCLRNLNLETFAMTYTGISGDVSSLSHMTNLKALYLAGTNVAGDISSLSGLTNLEELALSDGGTGGGSLIHGDFSSLDALQKLKKARLYDMDVTNCEHFTEMHLTITEGGCSPESQMDEDPAVDYTPCDDCDPLSGQETPAEPQSAEEPVNFFQAILNWFASLFSGFFK